MALPAQKQSAYLTPQELVQRWNGAVTTGTLANWRNQGKGPAYTKFGSRVRYKLESVEAYEAKNMIGANDNDER
ncbi:putative MerR family transcription regulator [Enterobacter phage Arya]|uniref:Putative MerR family transcription regulator n=1 Tax=Enterobacter phage Arya TaxID=1864622 RepID=A0A193GYF4_9CAUD|nr:putative MerR family transcription regulator [Enterobacter phage Arya]ANN86147.1 putative MerR family transcription regulator [Enterobacter phage Arya]